jgi:hypothetical protein
MLETTKQQRSGKRMSMSGEQNAFFKKALDPSPQTFKPHIFSHFFSILSAST